MWSSSFVVIFYCGHTWVYTAANVHDEDGSAKPSTSKKAKVVEGM